MTGSAQGQVKKVGVKLINLGIDLKKNTYMDHFFALNYKKKVECLKNGDYKKVGLKLDFLCFVHQCHEISLNKLLKQAT